MTITEATTRLVKDSNNDVRRSFGRVPAAAAATSAPILAETIFAILSDRTLSEMNPQIIMTRAVTA